MEASDSKCAINIHKLKMLLRIKIFKLGVAFNLDISRIVSTLHRRAPRVAAECRWRILANSTGFFFAANIRAGSSIVRMSRERLARE